MATGKNTKGKANNGGSQANVQHDGLMALESRLLFSAVAWVSEFPGSEPSNDGTAAIEAIRLPDESHSVINPNSMRPADNPEGSNPTPHPMPVPELFPTVCPIVHTTIKERESVAPLSKPNMGTPIFENLTLNVIPRRPIILYAEEGPRQTPVVLENKDASPASALMESLNKSVDAVLRMNRLGGQEGAPIVDAAHEASHVVQQRSGQTPNLDVGALGILGANYDKTNATYADGDLNEHGEVLIRDGDETYYMATGDNGSSTKMRIRSHIISAGGIDGGNGSLYFYAEKVQFYNGVSSGDGIGNGSDVMQQDDSFILHTRVSLGGGNDGNWIVSLQTLEDNGVDVVYLLLSGSISNDSIPIIISHSVACNDCDIESTIAVYPVFSVSNSTGNDTEEVWGGSLSIEGIASTGQSGGAVIRMSIGLGDSQKNQEILILGIMLLTSQGVAHGSIYHRGYAELRNSHGISISNDSDDGWDYWDQWAFSVSKDGSEELYGSYHFLIELSVGYPGQKVWDEIEVYDSLTANIGDRFSDGSDDIAIERSVANVSKAWGLVSMSDPHGIYIEVDENGNVTNANIIKQEACPAPDTGEEETGQNQSDPSGPDLNDILVSAGGVAGGVFNDSGLMPNDFGSGADGDAVEKNSTRSNHGTVALSDAGVNSSLSNTIVILTSDINRTSRSIIDFPGFGITYQLNPKSGHVIDQIDADDIARPDYHQSITKHSLGHSFQVDTTMLNPKRAESDVFISPRVSSLYSDWCGAGLDC